ncbi:hypothetical protein HMH05_27150 [Pseudomonas sp. SbB1]|uniref:hypothetical protein n=1 Tax=Pseudomonas TaxID=286 RepID=UPI00059B3570|nr:MULTISPECIES: hypothetical protein [Pseudomonas]ANI32585.1 hypothetical protein AA098_03315 [Pseudomonas sp. JY-Q]KPM58398.1 hypothetical protein HB4184_25355 [Pseudomonas putida]MBP0711633.1 hypothetical protein [Pseudomonas sp. T34]MCK2191090.1 hypothetical protein [Pseudomonas sp. MB04B]MDD2088493.1 hypothetical protein [Pseudomonas putida]
MAVTVKHLDLQQEKYKYTWKRDKGDGTYAGPLDRAKVDKDEGYEVADFIEKLMNDHGKSGAANIRAAEEALKAPQLSTMTSRADLYKAVKADLRW